jgi:predicted TIM-barrel enzyme
VDGFFGASSIERLPTEPAIEEQTRRFTELDLASGAREDSNPSR